MVFLRHMAFLAFALLTGCATTLVREEPKTIAVGEAGAKCAMAPLAEALLARRGTSVQAINGSWKEHAFTAECVTKGVDGKFTAIFLAPQMRLATLTITPPHTLSFERARQIPAAFEPEYALFDLAVVNLPTMELRRALGENFIVVEAGGVRTVVAGGVPVARMTRLANGMCHYENLALDYVYDLKEVK